MKFKDVNKSTAILANTGEDNLISRAKAVSDRPVLLIASSVDVVGDDDDDDIETPSIMNNDLFQQSYVKVMIVVIIK